MLLWGAGLGACAPSPSAGQEVARALSRPLSEVVGGRLFNAPEPAFLGFMLVPDGSSPAPVIRTPDGLDLYLIRGTRWVHHLDGRIERASQVFLEEDVSAQTLPPRLGGGFLFHATSNHGTLIWRAQTWTSDLVPLARVEPPTSRIDVGFDRLYLESRTQHRVRGLDPFDGRARSVAPLPPAAARGDMVFADAWTAVVLSGVEGPQVTFDAGQSWHPLGLPAAVKELSASPRGGVLLSTEDSVFELDPQGRLMRTTERGSDKMFAGALPFVRYGPEAFPEAQRAAVDKSTPLGRHPLREAVLHGFPDTPKTAVVVSNGHVGRVRLSDGKVLSSEPFSGTGPCRGVLLGEGFGFICGDERSPTHVYAYVEGRLVLDLATPRATSISESGNGALVLLASCNEVKREPWRAGSAGELGLTSATSREAYCVRRRSGELFEVRVGGGSDATRVIALVDGRAAVLSPPAPGAKGSLTLVGSDGAVHRELSLPSDDERASRLARSGLWLDSFWQSETGGLGGWIVGARAFAGVAVELDGEVSMGPLQEGVDETSFHGATALQIAGSATLRESVDFGFEWHVAELPPAVAGADSEPRGIRGCSRVGCARDGWVRIGFDRDFPVEESKAPEVPESVSHDQARFSYWTLSCVQQRLAPRSRSGRASEVPASPGRADPAPFSSTNQARTAPESSAFIPFQGVRPPRRTQGEVGYDFGETNEHGAYRAYAWGPGGADWLRSGSWLVRIGDRFSTAQAWSTAVTRTPWQTAAEAAQTFGLDQTVGVDWWLRAEAAGRYAVIHVRLRSDNSLHLLEPGRSITTLSPSVVKDLGSVSGVQKLGDDWYLGAAQSDVFHLYRVEGERLEEVRRYPLYGRVPTQLVGSVHGDQLALWQRSDGDGWFVYPLDSETFEPDAASHVSNELLSKVPSACEPGRPGWVVTSGVPLTDVGVSESNTHIDFAGGAEGLETRRLTARLVVDAGAICVDGLAAVSDGDAPRAPPHGAERRLGSFPLVVTNTESDERYPFACRPQ